MKIAPPKNNKKQTKRNSFEAINKIKSTQCHCAEFKVGKLVACEVQLRGSTPSILGGAEFHLQFYCAAPGFSFTATELS